MLRSVAVPIVISTALSTLATVAPAQAGTGGFRAGDFYLFQPAWSGISSFNAGIVRIDPLTGATEELHAPVGGVPGNQLLTYDPWRDRLLFFAAFTPNQAALWASDAAGNVQNLGYETSQAAGRGLLTPRGDGIVYLVIPGDDLHIRYLDAANQEHILREADGTTLWTLGIFLGQVQNMVYVPKTNSLVLSMWHFNSPCAGIPSNVTSIHRLDLSPDGSSVIAETCFWYDSHPTDWDGETRGLSIGPDGDPILIVGNGGGSSGPQGRIAQIDMETNTASAYATTDFFAQHRIVGGTYSHTLGRAVVHDSFEDRLRVYAPGQVGGGSFLSDNLSASTSSGERASMIEIFAPNSATGLSSSVGAISLSAGGSQPLDLDVGSGFAGATYLVLGSLSGWTPGFPVAPGVHLPLNPDAYFSLVLGAPNQPPLLNGFGLLDPQGRATATFELPAGSNPAWAGLLFHHAAVVFGPGPSIDWATNAVPAELVP